MKKTLIIVAVIAVVAVVAFLLFSKKDDSADGKTMGLGNPNAGKSEEQLALEAEAAEREKQIEAAKKKLEAVNGEGFATQAELESTGVILTAQEKREQQDLANRYFKITGVPAKDQSLDSLRLTVPELEKAKKVYDKLQSEFPAASYDVDYSKILLGKQEYDEEIELQNVYNSLVDRQNEIKDMAANFAFDLCDGIVWSDQARIKRVLKAVFSPTHGIFNDKDGEATLEGYRAWNTDNMDAILTLTPNERKKFQEYMTDFYQNFIFRKGGEKLLTDKQNRKRKNCRHYNAWSGFSTKNGFVMTKFLTYNGQDKSPHDTGYFKERDAKSGKDYSILLYNKFAGK